MENRYTGKISQLGGVTSLYYINDKHKMEFLGQGDSNGDTLPLNISGPHTNERATSFNFKYWVNMDDIKFNIPIGFKINIFGSSIRVTFKTINKEYQMDGLSDITSDVVTDINGIGIWRKL